MAQRPKRASKQTLRTTTALDAQQLALKELERKIREQQERCTKVIADAPKIAAERERLKREEQNRRAASPDKRRAHVAALPDPRHFYQANVAAPARDKRLRAERRQGRLTFFILLLALAAAIFYLYYTVTLG